MLTPTSRGSSVTESSPEPLETAEEPTTATATEQKDEKKRLPSTFPEWWGHQEFEAPKKQPEKKEPEKTEPSKTEEEKPAEREPVSTWIPCKCCITNM